MDGERLKQIRFLLFVFRFEIPYEQRDTNTDSRQSVDQRKKKTFSVIQFHFTCFSTALLILRASCGSFYVVSFSTHTHTHVISEGLREIEASSLLVVADCEHKRRNIWFREG